MPSPKKIVVIGPESTGKTTLCEALANHYGTAWAPEYAREYLLAHGTDYRYEDLLTIAKGQLALEDAHTAAPPPAQEHRTSNELAPAAPPPLLFIDTDMYVMKVWCEFVFGKCHTWILDQIAARKYDGYLLCCTDLPWVKDELREYPDLVNREKLFHIYKDAMVNQNTPWIEIDGIAEQRLGSAASFVDKLIAG